MTPPPLPEKAERAEKGEKGEKAEKSEKADRGERAERAEKTDRPEAVAKKDDGTKGAGDILGDGPAPSIPPPPAAGPWRSYKEIIAFLASRIVEAQQPIRVLQSLRWENSVEEQFMKSKGRELPKVDPAYYEGLDLGFDPRGKSEEFEAIARDIDRELGEADAIGNIMASTAIEYRDVVRMLSQRGKPLFYAYSRKLYGSPKDKFPDGKATVRDLGHAMYEILTKVDDKLLGQSFERNLTSADAVAELNARFARYFGGASIQVQADDTIIADAAAGSDYVKVRTGARFSPRDIDILEVHEGWVHVATSLNGQNQTVAKWLAKGPPRTVAVQEGLAALLEIFTFRMYPRRARRLNDRIIAIDKAEDGASFLDVYEWFRTEGYDEEECFHNTRRDLPRRRRRRRRAVHQGRLLLQGGRPQLRVHLERHPAEPRRPHPVPVRRQGRARRRPGARAPRRRGGHPGAALPAADVPGSERARDVDGVLDLLRAARHDRDHELLRQALRPHGVGAGVARRYLRARVVGTRPPTSRGVTVRETSAFASA